MGLSEKPMISLEQCKEVLGVPDLNDSQIEVIRDALYSFISPVLDVYFDEHVIFEKGITDLPVDAKHDSIKL